MECGWLGTSCSVWGGIFVLAALSAAIWLGWYVLLAGRTGQPVHAAVAAQVLYIAQVLGTMLILGWIGVLRPVVLAGTAGLEIAALWWFGARPNASRCAGLHRRWIKTLRAVRPPFWVWLLGLLQGILVLRNAFWGWFLPPLLRDDIAYHLPIMGSIVQSGAIRYWASLAIRVRTFPINSEIFQAWNFLFLGVDKLVDLAFLPTILVGGLAVYALCRRFGYSRRAAAAGWAVFAFTPLIFLQQLGSYNDAWMASLFAAGMYFAIADVRSGEAERLPALLAGTCAGIIAGTKFTGFLSALVIGGLWLAMRLRRKDSTGAMGRLPAIGWKKGTPIAGACFLAGMIFFCAYPIVRNAVYEGNPIAPAEVRIAGVEIFSGRDMADFLADGSEDVLQPGVSPWSRILPLWLDRESTYYDYNNGATGPLWIFLGIPGAFFWFLYALRRRSGLPVLIGILSLGVLALTPAQWRPRYDLPLLVVSGLGAAFAIDVLGAWPRRVALAGLAAGALFVTASALRPIPIEPGAAMNFVLHCTDLERNAAAVQPENEFFSWIDTHTIGRPLRIAYGRRVDIYPLMGADLRNTIVHQRASGEAEWAQELADNRVDLVVTSAGTPEEEWTRDSGNYSEVQHYGGWTAFRRN